jgi:hypothetical protein
MVTITRRPRIKRWRRGCAKCPTHENNFVTVTGSTVLSETKDGRAVLVCSACGTRNVLPEHWP